MTIATPDQPPDISQWDPRIARLYNYWLSRHPLTGGFPGRADIDPLDIPDLLRWIWMIDVTRQPLRFRFRLFGTAHVEAMGKDPTGHWIEEAFPGFLATDSYPDYVSIAEQGRISHRRGPAHYHVEEYKTIERLMLPLAGDDGKVAIILSLTVYHDPELAL